METTTTGMLPVEQTPMTVPAQEPTQLAPTPTEQTAQADGTANQGKYVLRVDENGKRTLSFEDGEPQPLAEPAAVNNRDQQTQSLEQPSMAQQVQQAYGNIDPNAVQPYDLQEFSNALASNNIDERRVPEQFKEQYIDYTIKRAQQEYDSYIAAQAHQRDMIEQQLNQKPDPAKQQEFFTKLNEESKARALADLGITEEDYRAKEFEDEALVDRFETAKEWHRNRLINELQSRSRNEELQRSRQVDMLGQIQAYVKEQRAKEPHFDEIDRMMGTLYQELPYNKATVIANAIQAMKTNNLNPSQLATLQEYYEIGRQMFYARRNGLAPNGAQHTATQTNRQPPMVERPGTGETVGKPPSVTEQDMRNAKNTRDRKQILYELLKVRVKR